MFYVRIFRPHCQRANLRIGEFQYHILGRLFDFYFAYLELKMSKQNLTKRQLFKCCLFSVFMLLMIYFQYREAEKRKKDYSYVAMVTSLHTCVTTSFKIPSQTKTNTSQEVPCRYVWDMQIMYLFKGIGAVKMFSN